MKLGTVILSAISISIWRFVGNGGLIGLADSFLMGVYDCCLITFISSFDASNRMSRKWKIAIKETDFSITFPSGVFQPISLQFMIGNYYQILAIFLAKQTVNSIRKKEEAIAMSINPIIKWRNQKQYDPVQTQSEMKDEPTSDTEDEEGGPTHGFPRFKSTML